jgi:hypothetical protein
MRLPGVQFTVRRMIGGMAVVVLMAVFLAWLYVELSQQAFYGPGGTLDQEYKAAARDWEAAHPRQTYPVNAPLVPDRSR